MKPGDLSMTFARRCLIAATLALAGWCGAASAETLSEWTNATVNPNGDAGMLYMSTLQHFGTPYGLDLKMVALKGDPLLLKALIAGQVDSYIGGPGSPMIAASKGADVRIIGCNWVKQNYVLWGRGDVKALGDLRGRNIGISTPGSAPDIFVRAALKNAGLSIEGINFVSAGTPPGTLAQLVGGVIDATTAGSEYSSRAKAMGLNMITTSMAATPLSMQRCYFVSSKAIKADPDRVARFLAAEMAAYDYSLSHRAETIALTRSITRADAEAREPIDGYDFVVDSNTIDMSFEPPLDKLDWLRDVLVESGQIPSTWKVETMIDRGPLEKARVLFKASAAAKGTAAPH
jgi:NitT/TauT family transport system substrate-binding protein